MQVPADDATRLSQRQALLSSNLQETGQDLKRAARHHQRLGKPDQADPLDASASEIIQGARQASDNAIQDLDSVSTNPDRATDGNQQMTSARDSMSAAKERLKDRSAADANVGQTAKQFAETLDELDQAIAAENANANNGDNGTEGESGNTGSRDGSGGNGTEQQTAASVSPTLKFALGSVAQKMARQRRQAADATDNDSSVESESSEQADPSPTVSDGQAGQAGSDQTEPGDPPGGPSVSIDAVDLRGDEWGQLRSRVEDANSSESRVMVPAQYRQEIEAYFRTIAEEGTRRRRSPRP
jgi:hypothetical protein